ncbi:hypothetical protein DDB_G0282643 [Dictyostelium discoideum AX4]|uniref:Uncharacterized protein n=1 Tax=Dictyostelium discoideum TaxID=44689 RepID=Q54S67_DICDI|nr:hypothetical protein DDB_G0282643 [Dictyostelium discoideum AX4]EAL66181.1 hypothetical protein DDB_G0282643 [Dictyostelium discoideum AX4]|eukprot:XP_640172.1 hypothetical protein DDB_G0282643 [Dictyostelium discoideum AX4]
MLLQLSKILILCLMFFFVRGQDSSSTISSSSVSSSSVPSSSSESFNGQYIFSFTEAYTLMAIDISNGNLVVNHSLSELILPSSILSYDPTTYSFRFFGYYEQYPGYHFLLSNYSLTTNTFTAITSSILDSLYYSYAIQPYVQIGTTFYMPIFDDAKPSTDLNIRNWDFNNFIVGTLEIELPDFNASISPLDAYDEDKDLYYVFYYGNGGEVERIPYVSTFTGNSLSFYQNINGSSGSNSGSNSNGGESSFTTTKFPNSGKSSLVYNNNVGTIFVKSSNLYAIEQLQTSINIVKIDLDGASVELAYSAEMDSYTADFISYFLTNDNNYLVTLNLNQDNLVVYNFIDLTTFSLAHSFTSKNYFDNISDDFDTSFYFNGFV